MSRISFSPWVFALLCLLSVQSGIAETSQVVKRLFVTDEEIKAALLADLQGLNPAESAKDVRYLTLINIANINDAHGLPRFSTTDLDLYRSGVDKLLNSLSWRDKIVRSQPIDANKLMLRVRLSDYGWDAAFWERIITFYPYAILSGSKTERATMDLTGTQAPFIRADWFVFALSQPPLYHEALSLPESRGNEGADVALEKRLGVTVNSSRETGRAVRSGFEISGVSLGSRMIERHPLPAGGGYWKTYDFNPAREAQPGGDLLTAPLGPPGAGLAGNARLEFKHDGGEILWALPNGLQAYLLVDAAGKRLGQVPREIMRDASRPDSVVINGVSCISCHSSGMVPPPENEITTVARTAPGSADAVKMRRLYRKSDMAAAVAEDTTRFQRALLACGADLGGKDEPVRALYDRFLSAISAASISSEFGVQEEVLDRLSQGDPDSKIFAARLKDGGGIPRVHFISQFKAGAAALNLTLKTFQAPPFEEFGGEKNLSIALQESGLKLEPPLPGAQAGSIDKAKKRALELAEAYRSQGFKTALLRPGGLRADASTLFECEFVKGLDVRLLLGTDQIHNPLRLQVKNGSGEMIAQGDSGGPLEFQTTYSGRYKFSVQSSRDDALGVFAIHGASRPSILEDGRTRKPLADRSSSPALAKTSPIPQTAKPNHLTHDQGAARLGELKQRGYAVSQSQSVVHDGKLVAHVQLLKGAEVQTVLGADAWDPPGTLEIDDAEGLPVTFGEEFNYEFKEVLVVSSGITRRLYTPQQGVVKFIAPYTGEYRFRMNVPETGRGVKAFLGVACPEKK